MNLNTEPEPRWKVEPYSRSDKHINISGPLWLTVDYDDVDPSAVDILVPHFVDLLNRWWSDIKAYHCTDEDCESYWALVENDYSYSGGFCKGCGAAMEKVTIDT